jgi:hypothetical protein
MLAKKLIPLFSICLLIALASVADAATPITVENYSFEIPGTGKPKITVGAPGTVTGWARTTDSINDAGCEQGNGPTNGIYSAYMGKDVMIFNYTGQKIGTEFLAMEGDKFQLKFDAHSTWHGDYLAAQLYYKDDAGNRIVFATTNIDLWNKSAMATYTLDSNAVGIAARDHNVGIQFKQTRVKSTDDNLWLGLDNIQLTLTSSLIRAQNPSPAHESSTQNTDMTLTWAVGPDAPAGVSYRVYLSSNFADVNNGAAAALKDSTSTTSFPVSGLSKGLTYYWRVDTVAGANTYRGNIWKFAFISVIAYNPNPASGANYVSLDVMPGWQAGSGAVLGHVVFFGDNFADVNNAPVGTSGSAPFRAYITNPADVNWAPSESGITLAVNKTYYWRIDEVQSLTPKTIYKGEVWSFTTVPVKGLGSILCQVYEGITGDTVADLTGDANYPDIPSSTEYLTTFEVQDRGFVNYGDRIHGYLYIRNTGNYTFWIASGENSQLWLSNEDNPSSASVIAFVDSAEGRDGWTLPRQWDKYPEIQQSNPTHLEAGKIYYIMALRKKGTWLDNLAVAWSGPDSNGVQEIIPGTSLIPFDQVKLLSAYGPKPANRTKDLVRDPILSWVSGEYAAKHDVYFGTNYDDVNNAGRGNDPHQVLVSQNQLANTHTPRTLNFETTYYWRIDEVNDAHPDKLWKGPVWSFTVGSFLIVDDFEDYNNFSPHRVFQSWLDSIGYSADEYFPVAYNGNGTGALVGHDIWSAGTTYTTIMETSIVHGGRQSMPLDYNNVVSPYYSETQHVWATSQNWTTLGIKALTLWFRGIPASVGSLTYDQATGTYTMTGSGADIWDTADQFHFAYKKLTGDVTIIARIDSITNTNSWAKAGVMIRETLDPGSPSIDGVISADGRVAMQWRTAQGIDMGSPDSSTNTAANSFTLPHWVKLTRTGFVFNVQHSADGVTWQDIVPETEGDPLSMSISMATTVYVGLAVTAHNATAACEAKISHVTINGSSTSPFTTSQDIGIASNNPAPLYVTLEDDTGGKKTVNHANDPNAVLQNTWQEWNISLSSFTGVKLDRIKKMSIGTGNKSPGGAGSLYFDDIRLYRSRCVPSMAKPAADINSDCKVDYPDLDVMANQWLRTIPPETTLSADLNTDNNVNMKDYAALAASWLEEKLWP